MSEHLLDAVSAAAASLKGTPRGAVSPSFDLDRLSPPGKEEEKKTVLQSLVSNFGRFREGDGKALLADLLARRRVRLDAVSAARFDLRTVTPLTLHLSRAGVLENAGICLHRVYGFPVLPGTGLKGMARAYAETLAGASVADIARVFGHEGKGDDLADAGELVFHDAWPTEWPKLIVDIANNHHRKYYAGTDAPGDWEEPNPVSFLALAPGASFSFALSKRSADVTDASVALAEQWLRGALVHLGAGAKTAAGYGWFADAKAPAKGHPSRQEYTLEVVTPAFLAGAEQKAEDCTLRSATVKGLLRWWWRTMHAGHVTHEQLLAMESVIFGSTTTGQSMVDVVVEGEPAPGVAAPYKTQQGQDARGRPRLLDTDSFYRQRALDVPRGGTPPVAYAAYGMVDVKRARRGADEYVIVHRPVQNEGTRFSLRVSTHGDRTQPREAKALPGRTFQAAAVREQVEAALWLLTTFGSVGGRSRKGFGSFTLHGMPPLDLAEVRRRATSFRAMLRLDAARPTRGGSACIDRLAPVGATDHVVVSTKWREGWFAMHQVGDALSAVASAWKHQGKKIHLGLPRQIHGPLDRPLDHQRGHAHQPPLHLRARELENPRHASPVHVSLDRGADGTIVVRALAFESPRLGSDSRSVLSEYLTLLHAELRARADRTSPEAKVPAPSSKPVVAIPSAREERWHPVTVTLNPGSGELSTGFQGQRASVRGEAARKIREALAPASQERLTKKRELKNVAVRVRVDGNQRDLVAIEIAS